MWFFVSPWAYFGYSDQSTAWNAWIIGALMVIASMARLVAPQSTSGFSAFNAGLSVWVLISPFILGYTAQTALMVNTLAIGAVALSCSILSLIVTKDVDQKVATADTWAGSVDV